MKVFISHSKEDKWLVRLIAPELEKLGVVPYYYEMNEMGAHIREKIHSEIEACDEFLVLLTPISITHSWVLSELAIADYLRKRIVPFYMYIKDESLPPSLTNVLRRHFEDLAIYYEELRKRMVPELVEEKVKVHETQAGEDAAGSGELAMSEAQQAAQNPYKASELFDHVRRIIVSAPPIVKPAPPPEPPSPAKPS